MHLSRTPGRAHADQRHRVRRRRFAELGYVAFALDYYGGGKPLEERAEINARLTMLMDQPQRARSIATAGLDVLLAQPRVDPTKIAAVGYCFGGALVLELARTGADDPIIPVEHRIAFETEMRAAGVDWRMNLYGGALHSFTNPYAARFPIPGLAYDQATDERSWRAMLDLFDEVFA